MKTKIFAYEIRINVWVLATARIVNNRCYVNYCYADTVEDVDKHDIMRLNTTDISVWCDQNNAILWAF